MIPQIGELVRTVIVGAGPTGLFTAIALARRGRAVVVVDRDPGPPAQGTWQRKGVMQFHHAHTFRGPVVEALQAEMPDVLNDLTTAGAGLPAAPGRATRGIVVPADDVRSRPARFGEVRAADSARHRPRRPPSAGGGRATGVEVRRSYARSRCGHRRVGPSQPIHQHGPRARRGRRLRRHLRHPPVPVARDGGGPAGQLAHRPWR